MDFLNRAFAQLTDLFKSMTPGARITAGLLLVVVVVSVGFLFNEQVAGPDAYLMGGEPFSSNQLRDMQLAFSKAGLEGYQIEGARVRVPRGQQSKYMAALAEGNALPPDFGDYLHKAANTNSLLTNRTQQEASLKIAKQRDLQNILNHMSGIEQAAVQIDEQIGKTSFPHQKHIITAMVSVVPKGSQPLDEARVPDIRRLVAAAVAGLKPEAVTIVDLSPQGQSYPGTGGSDNKAGTMLNEYAELKRYHEREYQKSVTHILSYIRGVLVTTSVELDPEVLNEEKSTEYDAKSVVFESRESTLTKLVEGPSPGGRPGLAAQGGVNQPATVASSSAPRNNEDTSQTEQRKAVPTTQKHVVREGRTPKRVTVSVAVPNSYYEDIWRKQHPDSTAAPDAAALADLQASEKKKIEEMIVPLLPKRDATADPFPQVAVTTFYPSAVTPMPEISIQDGALAWLGENWSTLGMGGLALVSLVMLRSMVKAVPVAPPAPLPSPTESAAPPLSIVAADEFVESKDMVAAANNRLRRTVSSGPTLRDELADIVREDPESAVSILRSWIGNAS